MPWTLPPWYLPRFKIYVFIYICTEIYISFYFLFSKIISYNDLIRGHSLCCYLSPREWAREYIFINNQLDENNANCICIYYFVYIQNDTEDENILESVINVSSMV